MAEGSGKTTEATDERRHMVLRSYAAYLDKQCVTRLHTYRVHLQSTTLRQGDGSPPIVAVLCASIMHMHMLFLCI